MASLNVPLSNAPEITVDDEEVLDELVDSENEATEESDEKKAQIEKERRETKRLLIIEEILETEKNYISCLGTLDLVNFSMFTLHSPFLSPSFVLRLIQ